MNFRKSLCLLALTAGLAAPLAAFGADKPADKAKDYQVTGPILSIEGKVVTIQKGDDKWELDVTDDTKIDGKLKVGEKVTIHYHMVAEKIDKKAEEKKK